MANISDTPLVSMVLVDDNNNRTTFTGPIINDFTITEDLQSKITQLTTLATNISNLQTRLTNITNILNTQNIEFTNTQPTNVSNAGSKLYIRPALSLNIVTEVTSPSYASTLTFNLYPWLSGSIISKSNSTYIIPIHGIDKNTFYQNTLCGIYFMDESFKPKIKLSNNEVYDVSLIYSYNYETNILYQNNLWSNNVIPFVDNEPIINLSVVANDSLFTYDLLFTFDGE